MAAFSVALGPAGEQLGRIGVEARGQQGAPTKEYSSYFEEVQRRWPGWIGAEAAE